MNATGDFATLLETALVKIFLGAYAIVPATWPRWCGRKSVSDLRDASFYRAGSLGQLDSVGEGGEILQKNVPDGEKSHIAATTKANIVGLMRRAMLNDDLNVFRDIAGALGEAAALTIEGDVFTLLGANSGLGPTQSDGQPLFHANRSNVGPAEVMDATTWGGAESVLAARQDPSKNVILELEPFAWLGPSTLRIKANQLNFSAADVSAPNSGVANGVQGMVREVIGTSRLTGTRHYFFANPARYPCIGVAFLDGREEPTIDSTEVFRFDGVQWRVRVDYGVGVLDPRPGVTCAGS